jgi:hypothetical protein
MSKVRIVLVLSLLVFVLFMMGVGVQVVVAGGGNGGGSSPGGSPPPITVGGHWTFFNWSGTPPVVNLDGPFTFSNSSSMLLKVTDAFIDGDRFGVYDNGALLGNTSVPADDGTQIGSDCNAAFANPKYSHATFTLAPGSHSVTMVTIAGATGFTSGSGCVRVDLGPAAPSEVPEADTLLLMSGGLGGLATWLGWQWRRVRAKSK